MSVPTYSAGVISSSFTYGSSMNSRTLASGRSAGFATSITPPSLRCTRYTTLGAVVMSPRSYSRSSRSCTISMCSSPKNPHRKPNPIALLCSGS